MPSEVLLEILNEHILCSFKTNVRADNCSRYGTVQVKNGNKSVLQINDFDFH